MKLSDACIDEINRLQSLYPEKRSALIPALLAAQKEISYLPKEIQKEIAILFNLDATEVHSVVTFYDMFHENPVGKHLIHLCKNASCMLRGSDAIMEGFCKHLKIQPHETTEDGEFTLIPSECLGACDKAPMILMDEDVVGPLNVDEIEPLLDKTKKRGRHG